MRKVNVIDAGNMKEKELCSLLRIDYTPWYKDSLFWSLCMVFCLPSAITLLEILNVYIK